MELIKYKCDLDVEDPPIDEVKGMDIYLANIMPKKRNEFTFFVYIDEGKEFKNQDILDAIKKYEYSDMIIFDDSKSIVAISIFASNLYNLHKPIDNHLIDKEVKFSLLQEKITENFGYINKIHDDK
jgi:hypothetical protein